MEKQQDSRLKKSELFRRIAQARTNRLLNNLRLLGNTANRNTYYYSDEQVDKIFQTIESRVLEIKGRFKRSKESKFEL